MAVILNASTSSGFIQTADTSGVLTIQNNGTDALSVSSSNLQFNSGYGSVATAYGCRAWVNFNGTGTVAIRASGNVSSITDNGTGDYTVNFTTAMPDVNYATVGSSNGDAGGIFAVKASIYSTTQVRVNTYFATYNLEDSTIVNVSVLR
jgi:uncharacterized protein (AIM24 family)